LTSLEYSPISVGGDFDCSYNELSSLGYYTKKVGGNFYCYANRLTSLEHFLTEVGGGFYSSSNKLPDEITTVFDEDGILSLEEQLIFLKYQGYYNVWTPEFNLDGFNELVDEIRDGLR
jgi:hypothetical protein